MCQFFGKLLELSFGKTHAGQFRDHRFVHSFAGQQHVEALAHASRRDKMFELQGNFGSLLWQAAFFKRISELICFTNPHKEL